MAAKEASFDITSEINLEEVKRDTNCLERNQQSI